MATPIDPTNVDDWDEALNTDPTYTAVHVFSTDDITGTFDGVTQGEDGGVIDFTADPKVTKEGVNLYPTDTEFGYVVTDFVGAEQKIIDGLYEEGWVGDLEVAGEHVGLVVSNEPTDFFKTPALLGTWLAGLGGNTVKASTEHYSVMQNVLSDQRYPGDTDITTLYPLDDNLIMIGGEYDGLAVLEIIAGADLGAGTSTVVTDAGTPEEVTHVVAIEDKDGDGAITIMDLLEPNETEIDINIAASDDYSVTMKDDGKLLYRWGNTIKKPNDVRIEAEIELPDEWSAPDLYSSLKSLYQITEAELVTHHTITNNPNDQVRPEDFENEAAIGTLPTYEIDGDGKWVTTEGYYAGDGTYYPAGTVLKDPALAAAAATSDIVVMGAGSVDLLEGYTNAWYTTMNREPFEPVLNELGTEYTDSGPRWRLQPDKYGQDLPSVVIPDDPSLTSNPTHDQVKYEVGAETQTVLNLLDWEYPVSPLSISAGWQDAPGSVSENGLNMTENFDIAFYIKGDIKPATLYSTELVLSYEELTLYDDGVAITGTAGSDYLVGIANNEFTGLDGQDLFVLSYGTTVTDIITSSIVHDFEVGVDTLGFIGLGVDDLTFGDLVTQELGIGGWEISIGGDLVATLVGISEELDMEGNFFMTNPGPAGDPLDPPVPPNEIIGTPEADTLIGTLGDDIIFGLAGNDYIYSLDGNDTLDGGEGLDRLFGGPDADVFVFAEGTGLDIVYDYDDGIDKIRLEGIADEAAFDASVSISDYRTTGALIEIGDDRMIVRSVDHADLTADDFIFDDTAFV